MHDELSVHRSDGTWLYVSVGVPVALRERVPDFVKEREFVVVQDSVGVHDELSVHRSDGTWLYVSVGVPVALRERVPDFVKEREFVVVQDSVGVHDELSVHRSDGMWLYVSVGVPVALRERVPDVVKEREFVVVRDSVGVHDKLSVHRSDGTWVQVSVCVWLWALPDHVLVTELMLREALGDSVEVCVKDADSIKSSVRVTDAEGVADRVADGDWDAERLAVGDVLRDAVDSVADLDEIDVLIVEEIDGEPDPIADGVCVSLPDPERLNGCESVSVLVLESVGVNEELCVHLMNGE